MCNMFFSSVCVANIVNNFDLRWGLILSLALDVRCVNVPSAGRRMVPAPSESGAMVPVEDNRPPAPDGPDKPRWDRQTSKLKLDSIFRCILKKILRRSSKLASRCRSRALFQIVILKFLFIYQAMIFHWNTAKALQAIQRALEEH